MKALIFDCDGVLVDTEKDGHRVAFNEAFKQAGLDVSWDVELYGDLLKIAGGKERMTHYFENAGWPAGKKADTLIPELHKRKTAIFQDLIASGKLPLRPGILRIVDEARAAGIRLAVCTTSHQDSVDGVLRLMGPQRQQAFEHVLAGDVVKKKKPNPEIYDLAKQRLNLEARDCVVIEDSRNGLLAATGAGMPCVITTSTYTTDEDFAEAALVVPELGDRPHVRVTVKDLQAIAARRAA